MSKQYSGCLQDVDFTVGKKQRSAPRTTTLSLTSDCRSWPCLRHPSLAPQTINPQPQHHQTPGTRWLAVRYAPQHGQAGRGSNKFFREK